MIKYKFPGEDSPRDINAIHYKDGDGEQAPVRTIKAVYKKVGGVIRVLWEAINSCFGSGYWINSKPWSNNDGWKNLP